MAQDRAGVGRGVYPARVIRFVKVASTVLFGLFWAAVIALVVFDIPGASPGENRFPDPVDRQAVYDPAGALEPGIEQALESQIDAIEERSGAELAIYLQVDDFATEDSNLEAARALLDQWGVGREGFDDGLVFLVSLESNLVHGKVSYFAGAGFLRGYLSQGDLQSVIDEVIVPAAVQRELGGGLISALDVVGVAITPAATDRLNLLRQLNAVLGLVGAPITFLVIVGIAFFAWRREGDDPEVLDSESILMAGPPAEMTPPLATVVRQGKATQHSLNTMLMEIASTGRIAFQNLDQIGKVKSDDEPNPLLDPAIEVRDEAPSGGRLAGPQRAAWDLVRQQAHGSGILSRERLWALNGELGPIKDALEEEVVRLGWFTRKPSALITRWSLIGFGEMALGGLFLAGGFVIPMSGLTLLGAATGLGGLASWGLGQFMSQRTSDGAYVDAMLKAYRRTLKKTLEQARSMGQVVAEPTVRMLADTPDKAVVWGFALGLHDEVAEVLRRNLEDVSADPATAGMAYYPLWLGSTPSTLYQGVATGSIFSGSGMPDIGGMFGAIGSIGSSPPSSSSGGGGFGGGGSSGGGGGSGSF
ncbi:MAG: TPM domain-containing protein [Chloroflexota bacterium]|nr:TPM domain-containing protein [Chloroflexota bacterium]